MYHCSKCNQDKEAGAFSARNVGGRPVQYGCNACHYVYEYHKRLKEKYQMDLPYETVSDIYTNATCHICGQPTLLRNMVADGVLLPRERWLCVKCKGALSAFNTDDMRGRAARLLSENPNIEKR